jgi:hypothetical protein
MNHKLLKMIEEAGFDFTPDIMNKLQKFQNLIWVEREACALAAEAVVPRHTECGNKIAGAIRARGQDDKLD